MDGTDSGWLEITDDSFTGKIYYRKIGNIVTVLTTGITLTSALTGTQKSVKLSNGGVPSGFRPKESFMYTGIVPNITEVYSVGITTAGVIYFYNRNNDGWTTQQNIGFSVTYITA